MLQTVSLSLLLLFSLQLFCQNTPLIHKKLVVTDFKGETDERSFFLARTYTVISLSYSEPSPCGADRTKVRLTVQTGNRLSDKSWIKADRVKSKSILAELLSHEQGHYDIGETFALDLQNKLTQTCFSKVRYKAEADSIFRAMNKRYDVLQQQYDAETNNMQNTAEQARWKKKIQAMLADKEKQ
ncbi:MAG: DUF922 domain-containing protein [Chitinophagaceae bacterium]